MPLSDVKNGKKVQIIALNAHDDQRSRLLSLGLLPGVVIEVLHSSTSGSIIIAMKAGRIILDQGLSKMVIAG